MPTALAHDIVRFLSLHGNPARTQVFRSATSREWQRTITWLDHSGLALYFLHRVETDAVSSIPGDILRQLRQRRENNEQRVARLKEIFESINQGFERNGLRYAVLKGFSLTPEYCANPCNRAQSDLDYLIAENSMVAAQNVLTERGFLLKRQEGEERSFWIPGPEPTDSAQQYSPNGPWMVELHPSMWDQSLFRIPLKVPVPSFTALRTHQLISLKFPCLSPTLVFAGQILHSFKHVLDGWIRLSWLFEIASFLRDRRDDSLFWQEFDQMVTAEPLLAEFVAIITWLAVDLFEPAVPESVQKYMQDLQPSVKVWLQEYAPGWLFERLPRYEISFFSQSKLSMFLKEVYCGPEADHRVEDLRVLFPFRGMKRLVQPRNVQTTAMRSISHKTRWLALHAIYHAGAALRYMWELPRWRRRTQLLRADGAIRNRSNSSW
jgi:Uncharacterised nucleotidyltransferase